MGSCQEVGIHSTDDSSSLANSCNTILPWRLGLAFWGVTGLNQILRQLFLEAFDAVIRKGSTLRNLLRMCGGTGAASEPVPASKTIF